MNKPTDAEIVEFMRDGCNCRYNDEADHIDFARAVLDKWGQPAHSEEPVAWLDPWTGTRVTTDPDAYGKHGIPLYTTPQPTQAQALAVPLTDEQIESLLWKYGYDPDDEHMAAMLKEVHGITGGQHGAE